MSFKGTLLFALYAVSLTLIFLSHIAPPITATPLSCSTPLRLEKGNGREPPDLSVRMHRGYSPVTLERGIFVLICEFNPKLGQVRVPVPASQAGAEFRPQSPPARLQRALGQEIWLAERRRQGCGQPRAGG